MKDTLRTGQLENGMCYYIRETDLEPGLVYLALSVKAGSFYDGCKKGIAHLLEHCSMSFEKYNRTPFPFCYRGRAYTDYYSTNYIFAFQKDGIMEVFDRVQKLISGEFLKSEQLPEIKQDVIEEWHKKQANTDYQSLKKLLIGTNYNEYLPIGDISIVSELSFEEVEQFFKDWYTPEQTAVFLVGDVSFEWLEEIKKLKFQYRSKIRSTPAHVTLSCRKLPEIEEIIPEQGKLLHYFYLVKRKPNTGCEQYIKESFHYDFCHDVIAKAFENQENYCLDKKGCQCNFFAPLQELFYFSAEKENCKKGEKIGQIREEILSFILSYFEQNFESMQKEYCAALEHYNDYINVLEMLNQCMDHYIYNKGLADCNLEIKILADYIYKIDKNEIKSLLHSILSEGAIQYIE